MNPTLAKALVALVPVGILFIGSVLLLHRERTLGSFLQLLGAGCLVIVVLTHSAKHSICFLGCSGGRSRASVTTSTSGVLLLV
jgi:hypothetical protein